VAITLWKKVLQTNNKQSMSQSLNYRNGNFILCQPLGAIWQKPKKKPLSILKKELSTLCKKDWWGIYL